MYGIQLRQWKWLKGSTSFDSVGVYGTRGNYDSSNTPSARVDYGFAYNSANELIYLFGGFGISKTGFLPDVHIMEGQLGTLGDLWVYNPRINQWKWVQGSGQINLVPTYDIKGQPSAANSPGARAHSTMPMDIDNQLWYLFGGFNSIL